MPFILLLHTWLTDNPGCVESNYYRSAGVGTRKRSGTAQSVFLILDFTALADSEPNGCNNNNHIIARSAMQSQIWKDCVEFFFLIGIFINIEFLEISRNSRSLCFSYKSRTLKSNASLIFSNDIQDSGLWLTCYPSDGVGYDQSFRKNMILGSLCG